MRKVFVALLEAPGLSHAELNPCGNLRARKAHTNRSSRTSGFPFDVLMQILFKLDLPTDVDRINRVLVLKMLLKLLLKNIERTIE